MCPCTCLWRRAHSSAYSFHTSTSKPQQSSVPLVALWSQVHVGAGPCACAVSAVTHHAALSLFNLFLACSSAYFIFIPAPQDG